MLFLGVAGCATSPVTPSPYELSPERQQQIKEYLEQRIDEAVKVAQQRTKETAQPVIEPTVSNVWIEADVKQVLVDLSMATNVPIFIEPSLGGTVTLSLNDVPLSKALEQILTPLGYVAAPFSDGYLAAPLSAKSLLYPLATAHDIYRPSHIMAEELRAMLPAPMRDYFQVDAKRNIGLLLGSPAIITRVKGILTKLDKKPRQVLIQAIIVDITADARKELGMDWTAADGSNLGVASGKGLALTWTGPLGSIDLISRLQALENRNQARIIASPRILAVEGEPANIFIGQEQFFPFQSGNPNFPFITIEKVPSGIALEMQVLMVGPTHILTDIKKAEIGRAVPDPDNRPIINRRTASTRVWIPSAGTIAIGGLIQEDNAETSQGVPFLSSVPILGSIAGNQRWTNSKTEITIFITATPADNAGGSDPSEFRRQNKETPA